MTGKSNLRYILLVFPAAIVALDIFFFYLDDFLDEGRSILFLDAYGQGYFTWWLDMERFWGNFELWNIIIGTWMGFFAAFVFGSTPSMSKQGKNTPITRPLLMQLLVLAVLLGAASSIGALNAFSPTPYSILDILALGWFPAYLPSLIPFIFLVFSGLWLLLPAVSKLRRGRVITPLSMRMSVLLLVPAIALLHLVLVSSWSIALVSSLLQSITSLIGLAFVTTPIFAFLVASVEKNATNGEGSNAREGDSEIEHNRKTQAWIVFVVLLASLGTLLATFAFTTGLGTGIDIKSDFIPRNFLTWITTALIASITFIAIQGGKSS
jgi:hypothetical protein